MTYPDEHEVEQMYRDMGGMDYLTACRVAMARARLHTVTSRTPDRLLEAGYPTPWSVSGMRVWSDTWGWLYQSINGQVTGVRAPRPGYSRV